jgi:hypothetical protein
MNVAPCLSIRYSEAALVVPFTRWKVSRYSYNGPFMSTPIIFVNVNLVATLGDALWGFTKQDASFDIGGGNYTILNPRTGDSYVSVRCKSLETTPSPAARALLARIIQQPNMSQKPDGTYVGSGFWWNLETAKLTDVAVEGEMTNYVLANLSNGKVPFKAEGTSHLGTGGALQIESDWTLTLPGCPSKDWSPWNAARPRDCAPRGLSRLWCCS